MLVSRLVVTAVALVFAVVGFGFWSAPDHAALRFGLEATGAAGAVSLRADLGGLFIAMAALSAAALWTGRAAWAIAVAGILTSIVIGRSIGWIADGVPTGDAQSLAIELVAIAALAVFAHRTTPAEGTARRRISRPALAAGGILLAAGGGFAVLMLSSSLQQALFDRAALQLTSAANTGLLADDAMRVAVCGSSAPLPSAKRAKACVAIFAGGKFYIVDVGPESVENLMLWNTPMGAIGGVLLTHFHSDHIGDLGELQLQTWVGGRVAKLDVFGGPGVEGVVDGFNIAYRLDQGYRTTHHTEKVLPSATWGMVAHPVEFEDEETSAKDRTALVLDEGGLRITAIEVDHSPITPAYAYRFDYKGRSVVVSGDLKYHPPLTAASRNADVLVSEAISVPMTRALQSAARAAGRDRTAAIMHDIEDYHITPEQAARIANEAGVKLLAFYHLLPAPDGLLRRRLFTQGVNDVRPEGWTMADDGSLYTLPYGSTAIRISRIE